MSYFIYIKHNKIEEKRIKQIKIKASKTSLTISLLLLFLFNSVLPLLLRLYKLLDLIEFSE